MRLRRLALTVGVWNYFVTLLGAITADHLTTVAAFAFTVFAFSVWLRCVDNAE